MELRTRSIAALAFLYLLLLGAIGNITGEFPINDDWAYYLPVYWLRHTGMLRFTNWQYMTLIGQTLVGWGWSSLFGLSFFSLRILTLLVTLGGLTCLARLTLLASGSRVVAGLVALAAAVSPLLAASATTFMTDLYFFAATVAAMMLLYRGLESERAGWLLAGWAMTIAAASVRQLAIAIPIGFIVADVMRNGWSRGVLVRGVLPFIVLAGLIAAYPVVVAHTIGLPGNFSEPTKALKSVLMDYAHFRLGAFRPLITGLGKGLLYFGLLGIPVSLAIVRLKPSTLYPTAGLAALGVMVMVAGDMPIPLSGNTLLVWGIGPRSLPGHVTPSGAGWAWWVVSAVACWSAAGLIVEAGAALLSSLRRGAESLREGWAACGLIVTAAVSYAPLVMIYGPWFDRHLLTAGPLLLAGIAALAARNHPMRPRVAGWIGVAAIGIASIIFVHDSFAWQRARWEAIARLERIAPSRQIDGGFEYNNLRNHPQTPNGRTMPTVLNGRLIGARCIVSADASPGVAPIGNVPIRRWLPLGEPAIHYGCVTLSGS